MHVPLSHGVPCVQHGMPEIPQSVHSLVEPVVLQTVPLSVQVPPGQHGSPSEPQDAQKPLPMHTSSASLHAAPSATHVLVLPLVSQQPPPVHCTPPSRQGCPVAPQSWHVVPEQIDAPPEHESPSDTHVLASGSQQPSSQGVAPVQQPKPLMPHGSQPLSPHTSSVPSPVQVAPLATHVPVPPPMSQQPPPVHCTPLSQQGCPVAPQSWHVVPEQIDVPPEHDSPSDTHVLACGSQQPV